MCLLPKPFHSQLVAIWKKNGISTLYVPRKDANRYLDEKRQLPLLREVMNKSSRLADTVRRMLIVERCSDGKVSGCLPGLPGVNLWRVSVDAQVHISSWRRDSNRDIQRRIHDSLPKKEQFWQLVGENITVEAPAMPKNIFSGTEDFNVQWWTNWTFVLATGKCSHEGSWSDMNCSLSVVRCRFFAFKRFSSVVTVARCFFDAFAL